MAILKNIKVLDLGQAVAGPFCAMLLADMGAEVIKVEPPQGDHFRHAFHGGVNAAINRNKRGIAVDLKKKDGAEILRRLISRADVFLESFTPGTIEKLGFGYDDVAKINDRIIYVSISGFGRTGPYSKLPGYDVVAQAMSGIMACTGEPGRPPVRIAPSLIDMGTGMYAAFGVLLSFIDRERTGQGKKIEANLLDTAISWMSHFIADYSISGQLPSRMGSALSAFSPYQVFKTSDKYVFVGVSTERFWKAFCDEFELREICQDPRFRTNADRCRNREELTQKLEEIFTKYPSELIIKKLNSIGVPCAPVLSLDEVVRDPHVLARQILQEVDHPEYGPVNITRTPLAISGKMPDIYRPAPMLGQHTKEILMEIGYDPSLINKLAQEGTIVLGPGPRGKGDL